MVTQAELRNVQSARQELQRSRIVSTNGPGQNSSPPSTTNGPAPTPKTPEELRGIGREITFAEKQVFLAQKDIAELQGRAGRQGQDAGAYEARIQQKQAGLAAAQAELDRLTGRLTSQGVNIEQARSAAPKNIRAAPREDSRTGINSIYQNPGANRLPTGVRVSNDVVQDTRTGEYVVTGGLRSGVYGNVIVQEGPRPTTAGQTIRNLQGGTYNPTRQNPEQLRNKTITVINRENTPIENAQGNTNRSSVLGSSAAVGSDKVGSIDPGRNGRVDRSLLGDALLVDVGKSQTIGDRIIKDAASRQAKAAEDINEFFGINDASSFSVRNEISQTARGVLAFVPKATAGIFGGAQVLAGELAARGQNVITGDFGENRRRNDPFFKSAPEVGTGIVKGFIEQTKTASGRGELIGMILSGKLLPGSRGASKPTISVSESVPRVEVGGVRFEARSVDVGGLVNQPTGALVPRGLSGLPSFDFPFFKGRSGAAVVPGAVRVSEVSGLPRLRVGEAGEVAPIESFLVRVKTQGVRTEGPLSAGQTSLPSDVLGTTKILPEQTSFLQLTPKQAEAFLPPIAGELTTGVVKPLRVTRVEPGSAARGTQTVTAATAEVDFFGVPKTVKAPVPEGSVRVNLDLEQLGFEIKKVDTTFSSPKAIEALRAFNEAAGDFFALNPKTGEFILARGTEARRFSRGTGGISARPTVSTGVLPEAIGTQKNLPQSLIAEFFSTPKGRSFAKEAAGISIEPLRMKKPVVKRAPVIPFVAAEELPPGGTMTADGQVLLQEPVVEPITGAVTQPVQETITEQKAEQKQKEKTIAGGKKARLTISEAASSSGRFPRQASIVLERGGNRITINEAMLRGGRFKRRILPLLSQTASTAPVQKTQDSLLSTQATTQDSLIAQDSLQAQDAAQAQSQSRLVRDLLIARNAQIVNSMSSSGLSRSRTSPLRQEENKRKNDPLGVAKRQKLVEAYDVFVTRGGKDRLLKTGLTRSEALAVGSRVTRDTLAAQFAVKKTGRLIGDRGMVPVNLSGFREVKMRKGRRIPTPDRFIQERGRRLSSRGERVALQRARGNAFFNGFSRGVVI